MTNAQLRRLVRDSRRDAQQWDSTNEVTHSNVLLSGKVLGWSTDSTRSLMNVAVKNRKRFLAKD